MPSQMKTIDNLYQEHCERTGVYYHDTANVVQQLTALARDEIDLLHTDAGADDYEPARYLGYLNEILSRWLSITDKEITCDL